MVILFIIRDENTDDWLELLLQRIIWYVICANNLLVDEPDSVRIFDDILLFILKLSIKVLSIYDTSCTRFSFSMFLACILCTEYKKCVWFVLC